MKVQPTEVKPPYPKWDGNWDTFEDHFKEIDAYEAKYGKREVLTTPYWKRRKKR